MCFSAQTSSNLLQNETEWDRDVRREETPPVTLSSIADAAAQVAQMRERYARRWEGGLTINEVRAEERARARKTGRRPGPRPGVVERVENPLPPGLTTTSIYVDPEVKTQFTIRPFILGNKTRTINWDGSLIRDDCRWNDPTIPFTELLAYDYGDGPYCPNFEGADYLLVLSRLLQHAQETRFPLPGLSDDRRDDHGNGMLYMHDCSCCYGPHWTSDCPIVCTAELRRLLFSLRGICLMCRLRHHATQTTCYIYTNPHEYPFCQDKHCTDLPKHHRCLCSNYKEDVRKTRLLYDIL